MNDRWYVIGILMAGLVLSTAAQARLTRTQAPSPHQATNQLVIEVFTDAEHPVSASSAVRAQVTVYRVDGLESFKAQLADGLPTHDTNAALREARRRLQRLSIGQRQGLQAAGSGLAKAWQYGIDRYPAIVFQQGQAVVYGLTNVDEALGYYQQ